MTRILGSPKIGSGKTVRYLKYNIFLKPSLLYLWLPVLIILMKIFSWICQCVSPSLSKRLLELIELYDEDELSISVDSLKSMLVFILIVPNDLVGWTDERKPSK
ncbi:hypothetical protein QUF50_05260 [Thiotrichales bacterium HSG1]|nr:hypothetical protein [Thiotrichales bacterium HSG1]